jgi:hypothetical protein
MSLKRYRYSNPLGELVASLLGLLTKCIYAVNSSVVGSLVGNEMEDGRSFEIPYRHLLVGTEEKNEKTLTSDIRSPDLYLPNTQQEVPPTRDGTSRVII